MSSSDYLSLNQARNKLAVLWLVGFVFVVSLLTAQTMGTAFGDRGGEVWNWIAPHLTPTLLLIIGVWGAGAVSNGNKGAAKRVNRTYFRAAFWLSLFYLLLLLSSILASPIVAALRPDEKFTIVDALKLSSAWLALVQGVVAGLIGVVFVKEEDAGAPK